jgi:hypothetical protein
MPLPRKAPFRCPHCGFVQEESEHLISTFCRSCGQHYVVAPNSASRKASNHFPRVPNAMWLHASSAPVRTIHCYRCGKTPEGLRTRQNDFLPPLQHRDRSLRCHNFLGYFKAHRHTRQSHHHALGTRLQRADNMLRGFDRRASQRHSHLRIDSPARVFREIELPDSREKCGH